VRWPPSDFSRDAITALFGGALAYGKCPEAVNLDVLARRQCRGDGLEYFLDDGRRLLALNATL
jgi:hypothetical protein